MKLIYSLREKLNNDPKYVAAVQACTLGNRKLPDGLKGIYGLFGSAQWWENITDGVAPVTRLKGIITDIYFEGMHNEGKGFEMKMADGTSYRYSCISNRKEDRKKYIVGKQIEVIYVTEPLKNPVPISSGGFQTETDTILEISVEN